MPRKKSVRKPLSVRTRFEVFKRDNFICRYCGRTTPDCVLEIDHIVPVVEGGSDDPMNLATSCWECNSGKKAVPLSSVMTGEDPHDRAIEILERDRQLREYDAVLSEIRDARERDVWMLHEYWGHDCQSQRCANGEHRMDKSDFGWFMKVLEWCPPTVIKEFMDTASARGITRDLRWVKACVRNWREERLGVA